MKKYTKPTAEVIELSVKESLSALPTVLKIRKISRTAALTNAAVATVYARDSVVDATITE